MECRDTKELAVIQKARDLVLLPVVLFAFLLSARFVSAQQLEPVLVEGQPTLKYTDKSGCESPIRLATIGTQEEALTIRVSHWHGRSLGEKGWLGITKSRIIFSPDAGQTSEHAFSIPRNEFSETKVTMDGKVSYLTIRSKEKKNQEFAIGCFGNSRDFEDMFIPVLNFAVIAGNNFDAGVKEFEQLTAKIQPQKAENDSSIRDLLGTSSKAPAPDLPSNDSKDVTAGDARTFFNLGETHLKLELYDEAVKAFTRAVQIRADYAEAYNGLGDAYLYSRRPQDAITAYSQAVKINPKIVDAYNGLGVAYLDILQPEDALKALKQAAKLQPGSPLNLYFTGLTYKKLGKRKEAIEALKEAVRLAPKYADAYETLGDLYFNSKEYEAAVEVYRTLVQLRPDSSVAHYYLATSYLYSGKKQEALNEYEITIKLNPTEPSNYHNIGNTYAAMGRFDDAIKSYKQAIALKSDYIPSHYMLGMAYVKKGEKASAFEEHNVLKSLDPNAAKLLLDAINK